MPIVDLRSDTLTPPGAGMRRAMAEAELGDDVYGEDPTVNRLQEAAADLTGKEASLFVASGTMGNLLGLLVNARAGQEVIADAESHLFNAEGGGAAALGGIQLRPLSAERGIITGDQVRHAVRAAHDPHQPVSAAVSVENTHNRQGGVAWPLHALREVAEAARDSGLRVHIDGARVFNAAIALGLDVREIAACADTITFCVSKGLGAPVGSLFCGPREAVAAAVRWRKMLGGGWREAGVLAAAGLYALEHNVERLADDHRNARTLAEGLAEMKGVDLDLSCVQTNLVRFRPAIIPAGRFLSEVAARGVLGGPMGGGYVRFVTHLGVTAAGIQSALSACSEVLRV